MTKQTLRINMDSLKQRKEWKRHAINAGENIYRILPPFGDASDGYPYRRWVIAWMTDPQTGRKRPFASPRSFGEEGCPVSEYAKALEDRRSELEAALKAKGANKDQIKDKLKPFGEVLWRIKPKASYIYNACNKAGEVGLLELKKTAHDSMKKTMMQYITDYGQDPTSLNSDQEDSGVWFKIKKEGEGTDTEYSVVKNQAKKKTADGLVFVDDRDALPQNVVDSYDNLGYDLTTLYKRQSYEELKEVLLMNLYGLYEEFPMARIGGFDAIEPPKTDEQPTKTTAKPFLNTSTPNTPAKAPVNLRLSDVDDEEEVPATISPKTVKPVTTKLSSKEMDDDVLRFADELLNS